jgi:serine/threonine-protein kinase HipA
MEIKEFFQLSRSQAQKIKAEVLDAVSRWQQLAAAAQISPQEQQQMAPAFNL